MVYVCLSSSTQIKNKNYIMHYRLNEENPSVIVTVNGSEKKIYEGNQVFLNNGENFELRFFNSLQEKIGAEISFNGKKTSKSMLVLNPGEDVSLDRFLNEKKKMLFETYKVDASNPLVEKAIKKNGLLKVKFYKEKQIVWTGYSGWCGINSPGIYTKDFDLSYTSSNYTCQVGNFSTLQGSTTSDFAVYSTNTSNDMGNVRSAAKKLETGRIEKGPKSNQNLNVVDVEFEDKPFHTVEYHLKPASQMVNVREIRNYCEKCSYRIRKSNWVYCPKCGQKL